MKDMGVRDEAGSSPFHQLLADLLEAKGVTLDVFGRILERVAIASPLGVSQAEIARGEMLARPTDLSPATVSRALPVLEEHGLVKSVGEVSSGGRHGTAWALHPDRYALIGIHIEHREGRVSGLTATLTRLDLSPVLAQEEFSKTFSRRPLSAPTVVAEIGELVERVRQSVVDSGRRILGVGIEIGGHVHDGRIRQAHNAGWDDVELAQQVADLTGLATVVENDINVRAVLQAYRHEFKERDFVMVAVLHEGVGGALVLDGRLNRGAGGVAGEIGHLFVDYESVGSGETDAHDTDNLNLRGFRSICSCGQIGHVETLAAPARILGELGAENLADVTASALADDDDRLTLEARTLRRAGTALGRGLVAIANIVNPARLVLVLPPELARPIPDRAGSAYLSAAEAALNMAFSTAADDARAHNQSLTVESLAKSDVAISGADAAGAFVLHSFIEAARGRRMVARAPRARTLQLDTGVRRNPVSTAS